MQFVKSETTESFVSRTNALLIVGSLISIGDISVSIATAFLSPGGNLFGYIGSRTSEDVLGHKPEKCTSLLCAEMPERVAMGEVLVNFKTFPFHFGVFLLIFRTRPTQRHYVMSEYIVSYNNNNNFQSKICQKKTLSCLENVIALLDYLLHYAFNRL